MKTKRDVSQQAANAGPVTFCDVAACFSEEEWKLLQDWQRELYRNVMKEINSALISLGPLIATSVFSLRPKQSEDMCAMDHQDSEIRGSVNPSQKDTTAWSDVLFRKTRNANPYLKDFRDTGFRESCDGPSTGYHLLNSDNTLRLDQDVEQEVESSLIYNYGAEGEGSIDHSLEHANIAPIVSFIVKEEREPYSIDHLECERSESLISTSLEGGTPGASIGIDEAGETYHIGIQDYRRRENINRPTGGGSKKKRRQTGDSTKCAIRAPPCRATPRKPKVEVFKSHDKETSSRIQVSIESNQELGGETTIQCQSGFSNASHSNAQHRSPKVENSDKYNECGSDLSNSQFPKWLLNTKQNQTPYASTECDDSYSLKAEPIGHNKSQTGVRPFICTECKKSFFQRSHLIRHFRKHTSEKPFACTLCHKRFTRKDHLNVHRRIHTGDRPHKCTECEKSFTWKGNLNTHQRKHANYEPGQ